MKEFFKKHTRKEKAFAMVVGFQGNRRAENWAEVADSHVKNRN